MKKFLIIILLLALVLGLYYWNMRSTSPLDDYVILNEERQGENLEKTLVIMQKDDYQSLLEGKHEGGEAPPAITLQVFNNPENPSPEVWVERYPQISNFPLKTTDFTQTTLKGRSAVSYEADGLYPTRNIVFTEGSRLYFISGAYLDRNSAIYRDFYPLLESLDLE